MRFSDRWKDIVLLLAGILVGLAFLNAHGTEDRGRWLIYIDLARSHGIFGTYPFAVFNAVAGATTDYPPLSIIFLAILSRFADLFHAADLDTLKVSLIVFTLACAAIVAAWQAGKHGRVLGVAMFLTLTVNALVLVYIDVYSLAFLLLALWFFDRGWYGTGAVAFVISILVKWQPIILIPFVVLYLWPRCRLRDIARFIPAVVVLLAALAVYGRPMTHAFVNGMQEPTFSGRALNFNWLATARAEAHLPSYVRADGYVVTTMSALNLLNEYPPDTAKHYLELFNLSTALRYACFLVTVLYFWLSKRCFEDLLRASVVGFFAYFIFGMAVHENHTLVPAALAVCWLAVDRTRWLEAVALGFILNINLLIFYGLTGDGPGFSRMVFGHDVSVLLAAFNVVFFAIVFAPLVTSSVRSLRQRYDPT
jgi:Gpi18-like mannosyltransferase